MSRKEEQARAYLDEAKVTLDGAQILSESRDEGFAQVVKNAYDALEQALSAGIARRGRDVPQYHHGKVERFFTLYDHDRLERKSLKWLSERETAQYVDFKGVISRFRRRTSTSRTPRRYSKTRRKLSSS